MMLAFEQVREASALVDPSRPAYDVALEEFEKGMTSARLDEVFMQVLQPCFTRHNYDMRRTFRIDKPCLVFAQKSTWVCHLPKGLVKWPFII